jgi:hypothetical protein
MKPSTYIHPRTLELSKMVEQSQKLAALAVRSDIDNETCLKALVTKHANDNSIMLFVKTANTELVNQFISKALSGLAIGAGVAIPLVAGGSYLANQMADRSEAASEKTWDRISNAALGAAGIGAGLYALNRLTGDTKEAGIDEDTINDLMTKIATTVAGEDTKKLAEEVRALNNGYLVTLLAQANR